MTPEHVVCLKSVSPVKFDKVSEARNVGIATPVIYSACFNSVSITITMQGFKPAATLAEKHTLIQFDTVHGA